MRPEIEIEGLRVVMTCGVCPEQYDVFSGDWQVGYLRLRHGKFRADVPECGGETVYSAEPEGQGEFEEHERATYLLTAILAIKAHLRARFA
jgi:hypothetical protein